MRWSSASNSRIVTFTASNPAQGRSASPDGCSASSDGAAYPRTAAGLRVDDQGASDAVGPLAHAHRSEEHTSELQSLMRISYAVFCLKKKKPKQEHKL